MFIVNRWCVEVIEIRYITCYFIMMLGTYSRYADCLLSVCITWVMVVGGFFRVVRVACSSGEHPCWNVVHFLLVDHMEGDI